MHMTIQIEKYVLITTKHRGVFAGHLAERDGDKVALREARCAIDWMTKGGFLELAQHGPNERSKIGTAAPGLSEFFGVTSISECSAAATDKWQSAPDRAKTDD